MSHPPQDGEVYKTTCTIATSEMATCKGDGLTATAVNEDGYFVQGNLYLWHVRATPPDAPAGNEGKAQSGD